MNIRNKSGHFIKGNPYHKKHAKLNEYWLTKNYLIYGKTSTDIAKIIGCSRKTVLNYLNSFKIPIRNRAETLKFKNWSPRGKKHWLKQPGAKHFLLKSIGTISLRHDGGSGTKRQWIKIKEPNVWIRYAHYLWLQAGKQLQKGLILHHKNLNSMDDRLENLQLLTRKEHTKVHNRWHTKNAI